MKTKTLFADGFPRGSFAAEDSAADAKIDALKSALVSESQRRGTPMPEFEVQSHDDARKPVAPKESK